MSAYEKRMCMLSGRAYGVCPVSPAAVRLDIRASYCHKCTHTRTKTQDSSRTTRIGPACSSRSDNCKRRSDGRSKCCRERPCKACKNPRIAFIAFAHLDEYSSQVRDLYSIKNSSMNKRLKNETLTKKWTKD